MNESQAMNDVESKTRPFITRPGRGASGRRIASADWRSTVARSGFWRERVSALLDGNKFSCLDRTRYENSCYVCVFFRFVAYILRVTPSEAWRGSHSTDRVRIRRNSDVKMSGIHFLAIYSLYWLCRISSRIRPVLKIHASNSYETILRLLPTSMPT